MSLVWSLSISIFLFIAWEIFEIIKKIEETKFNSTMDVVLSIISFLIIFYSPSYLSETGLYVVFGISLAVWIFLELWGYYAYRELYVNKKISV
jgi:hypothetical protein